MRKSRKDKHNNIQAFLALVKAGLWERDACLLPYGKIDFQEVYRLAQEQTVVGLVAAGLEYVEDVKPSKDMLLTLVGEALQLEQRNTAMNNFIGNIVEKMRNSNIYALLVKGQGIAQCYERPLWRACGDVDFFLSNNNYYKAKEFLTPLASKIDEENPVRRHLGMTIDEWAVELHATLRGCLWKSLDNVLDEVQEEVFCGGAVRTWMNDNIQVFLPRADEDVIFVFSHILQHFFQGGIGLRQICDLCRLIWSYKESIDKQLLESRLRKMGVMSEWHSFAYLAVNTLGMPGEAMPFYSPTRKWERKANKALTFILETGNFGHNRDYSYQSKYPSFIRRLITFGRQMIDSFAIMRIFPKDAFVSLCYYWVQGTKNFITGK